MPAEAKRPHKGKCKRYAYPVGAALAAKNATRCLAPAAPVFAAKAAPTRTAPPSSAVQYLWERL
ncbi:hypothetical protein DBB42_09735 [Pseudomonas plecoglossicida]|uniref:Uncharacterized protein n=1 Tax=Pseudomonas plecoglossicida TaxID=70775 RepID=A0A2R7UMY5_PSEDL|nr:hypothetical protein DBB42_09735 [Pseudomonas plecoglossicida]